MSVIMKKRLIFLKGKSRFCSINTNYLWNAVLNHQGVKKIKGCLPTSPNQLC
jgi:hypothetical protein